MADESDTSDPSDEWSRWLLHHRHGGDASWKQRVDTTIAGYADRVIEACQLAPQTPHATLVDIGTGDGVVAFRAIRRVGPGLHAVLTDISGPLLQHAQQRAAEQGLADQCSFLRASAEDLRVIPDASVDAVVARAALAYVADKPAALREFFRVLKPGGRVSVCEPLLQEAALDTIALHKMANERGSIPGHELLPLLHRWKAAQFPDTLEALMADPLSNYSERDLFGFFQASGFVDTHLELHLDARRAEARSWESFLQASPHPWAPPHGTLLRERFSEAEQQLIEGMIRPGVEAGGEGAVERVVFVSATKPLSAR